MRYSFNAEYLFSKLETSDMVQYLPSSATATITVLTAEVGTILTIIAPAEVVQGESFRIGGELRRADNNQILPGETITAVFNGTVIGLDVTGSDGSYNIDGVINDIGTYTLRVDFFGSTRLGLVLSPSQILRRIGISMQASTPMMVVASALLGAILVRVGLSK